MQITLYKNFSKKINSTKQPTGGTDVVVTLKNPTSRENPTFILDRTDLDYNYVKWGDHYYYITDITLLTNDHCEISCKQDILATYKSSIGSTSAFVEYATTGFNADILDPRISNTGAVSRSQTTNSTLAAFFDSVGSFIVSVIGSSGIANRYIMSAANLQTLMSYISTVPDDNVLDAAVKKYGSLLECIIGCIWVPFTPTNDGTAYPVVLGDYTVSGLSCKRCQSTLIAKSWTTSINIPWVNSEKGRQSRETMELYLPCYGKVALNTSHYIGLSSITLDFVVDVTGSYTWALVGSNGIVDYFNGSIGAQVPITQYTQSPIGMLASSYGNAMAWGAQDWASSGLGKLSTFMSNAQAHISEIAGRFANVGSTASSVGGQGGISLGAMQSTGNNDVIVLANYSFQYSEAQANMATKYGRPVFAVKTLNTLSGYIQCNGASVDIAGLSDDKNAVNAFLNSGFFYE